MEDQVAAWLLLKMLLGEALPGMEKSSGTQRLDPNQCAGLAHG